MAEMFRVWGLGFRDGLGFGAPRFSLTSPEKILENVCQQTHMLPACPVNHVRMLYTPPGLRSWSPQTSGPNWNPHITTATLISQTKHKDAQYGSRETLVDIQLQG